MTNESFCYKLLKSLLLIGYQQICHRYLSIVIEKGFVKQVPGVDDYKTNLMSQQFRAEYVDMILLLFMGPFRSSIITNIYLDDHIRLQILQKSDHSRVMWYVVHLVSSQLPWYIYLDEMLHAILIWVMDDEESHVLVYNLHRSRTYAPDRTHVVILHGWTTIESNVRCPFSGGERISSSLALSVQFQSWFLNYLKMGSILILVQVIGWLEGAVGSNRFDD